MPGDIWHAADWCWTPVLKCPFGIRSTDTGSRILVAMNILLLGTSSDAGTWFEGGRKRHEIAAERLEADFGEPVSVTVKSIWPTEKLPGLVAGWVEEYQPDAIHIRVPAFWFLHRSVPLRAQRLLGRFGLAIGQTGFRMAASRRWGHNRVFRGGRYVLQSTIGGDTNFTVDEVIERISECVRIAVRREGTAVCVKGPHGKSKYATTKRGVERDEQKRLRVHRSLELLCAQLHLPYDGSQEHVYQKAIYKNTKIGDGVHGNAQRHEFEAESLYRTLRHALESAGHEPK